MAVFKQGPRPEEHFTMIANQIARDPDIALRTKGVYLFMRSHQDGWHMTVERIAKALGVSKDTVSKSIKELEDTGYIVRDQAQGKDGRFSKIEYLILGLPHPEIQDTGTSSGDSVNMQFTPHPDSSYTDSPDTENWGTKKTIPKKINPKNTKEEEGTPTGVALDSPEVDEQGRFQLPQDWAPSKTLWDGQAKKYPGLNLEKETATFREYWMAATGTRSRKKDWGMAWQNWLKKAATSKSSPTKTQQASQWAEQLINSLGGIDESPAPF